MSYESYAAPIKLGYLFDFKLPESFPDEMRRDLTQSFELVFKEGYESGVIDRPIEIIFREVEGLPKGTIKAVLDAYQELVDEGCLAVFGPAISDNAEPVREAIEERFRVPAISVCGSEAWLGRWTFSLPQGSLRDEPVFWAELMVSQGHKTVAVLYEKSVPGETYLRNFRRACERYGLSIVAEEGIAQTAQDVSAPIGMIHTRNPDALLHCGFGFGVVYVNQALEKLDWHPPRYLGTAFQNAWINPVMWQAISGWVGIDQYDEANLLGQRFLDRYEQAYGRRPEYCVPVVNHDLANVLLQAFAAATPLTPVGVRDALEGINMLPAASGAPGTKISFGNWIHRGWMGSGYLVARMLESDGGSSRLIGRFGDYPSA